MQKPYSSCWLRLLPERTNGGDFLRLGRLNSAAHNEEVRQHMTVTEKTLSNAIRALSMDAVQAANSGHPGMPMGMADVATVLFREFLKFDPKRSEEHTSELKTLISNTYAVFLLKKKKKT